MSLLQNHYGHFSDDGNEYIITNYKTPKPWVNVISNGNYGLVISQTGGGFSWLDHSEFNRINRWHQDFVQDNWGKYFYIKDNKSKEIWSPTWMPARKDLEDFQIIYGFGYSKFISEYKGIRITLTIYVPLNNNLEIWNFKIENKSKQIKSLSIYSYFEWCLGSSSDHQREFHKTFLETDFDSNLNCMTATKRMWEIPLGDRGHWNIEYPYQGFIASSSKIVDYDGDKESFIGQYGIIQIPKGLTQEALGKNLGKWNDSIATVKTIIDIEPGVTEDINFFIGVEKSKIDINATLKKFNSMQSINKAFEDVKIYWHNLFDTVEIKTPDESMDLLVNKWLRYQAIVGRLYARTAYYQQGGAYGFRDQLQDSLVFLPIDPDQTAKQIRLHARHQKQDGAVLHWWHPISETGIETKITDNLLWLPFVILQYIDETNDFNLLYKKEPYYDNAKFNDSLFNHCIASIEKVLKRFSKRGLPLIGAGDWNDGLSAVGLDMKGESIWLAEFFYLILVRFADVCNKIGEDSFAKSYNKKAKELKTAFNKHAWDGNWFYRATKDNGEKIGSNVNAEGKIYLNPQTWAVISEIAEKSEQKESMKSVTEHLLRKNGCLLLSPAYSQSDKMIGYLSRYAPGKRENGGVYTHAATWAIWAYSILKDNKNAFEVYKRLSPINNGINPDEYAAEPYVTPGNIDGPDSPHYGMGGWTWYTGSASWFQKVIVEFILGVRATQDGLLIDPCIPDHWKEFSIKRKFRGTIYCIKFKNLNGNKGVPIIKVNGEPVEGNVLNLLGKTNADVEVII